MIKAIRTKDVCIYLEEIAAGLRKIKITESPLRKSLAIYLSLLTGLALLFPFPVFGTSVHISFTFSSTMLKCRSNALTRASSLRLFRQLMRTCVFCLTDWVSTDRGPVWNSSSSLFLSSSSVNSDLGLDLWVFERTSYFQLVHTKSYNLRHFQKICEVFSFWRGQKFSNCTYQPLCWLSSTTTVLKNKNNTFFWNAIATWLNRLNMRTRPVR